MISVRNLARNLVLHWLPPKVAHRINVAKNIEHAFLEPEMGVLDLVTAGPDAVAVDVGANLGLYCELLSRRFARVVAVEPQPWLAGYLGKIVPDNVEVVQTVASSRPGDIELKIPRMTKGWGAMSRLDALASAEPRWGEDEEMAFDVIPLKAETLDTLAAGLPRVDFIKIDVEGHELSVLEGATETIRNFRPLFLIEIERRHNARAAQVFETLEAAGYRAFALEPKSGGFLPASGARLNELQPEDAAEGGPDGGGPHGSNYLFNFFFVHEADARLPGFAGQAAAVA